MIELSLVIPCYGEAPTLRELVERTARAAEAMGGAPATFELVLVDNGSTDESPQVIAELLASGDFPFLAPIRVDPNRGYGHGMLSGLEAARGRVLATSHADLQCDPADVFRAWAIYQRGVGPADGGGQDAGQGAPPLVEGVRHGRPVLGKGVRHGRPVLVKGVRHGRPVLVKGVRHGRPLGARVVSRLFDAASLLLLQRRLYETNAQPKVFPRELLEALREPPLDFRFDLYLVLRALEEGYRLETLDVTFPPRVHGESHWAASFRGRWGTFAGFLGWMARYRAQSLPTPWNRDGRRG